MLEYLRKKSGGIFSIIIIGAIALVFIFWGIGGQNSGSVDDIRINDQPVSVNALAEMQERVLNQLRQQNPTLTPAEELNARRQALGYLVERQNLLDLAVKTKRTTSVEEINKSIKSNPSFQIDGRFSFKVYEELVPRAYNRSLAAFEANLAQDLLVNQTVSWIEDLAYTPTGAVVDDFHFSDDQLALAYVFFPVSSFLAEQNPSQDALSAYYEVNKETWRVPAEVKIDYVEVNISDFVDQVEVTEADLDDAYIEEGASLTTLEGAEVRHILFRFPSLTPSPEEKLESLQLANAALARAAGEDFATLAAELSQDSASAANGGSLGTMRRGETLPAFEEAVFGLGKDSPGTVVGPVETLFGYHLIKVDSYNPGHTKTRQEAAAELTTVVQRRKARRLAVNRIEDLLEALPTTPSPTNLKDTASSLGLEVKESDFFSANWGAPDFLADNTKYILAAVDTPVGQVGDPVDTPDHLVVYLTTEKKDSFIPPLTDENVREKVASAWKQESALKAAKDAAAKVLWGAADQWTAETLENLPEGTDIGQTALFARMKFYEAGAYLTNSDPQDFLSQYFILAKIGDQVTAPIKVDSPDNPGYLILKVSQIQPAAETELATAQLKDRQKTARASLANSAYQYWSETRRNSARVQLPPAIEAMFVEENF
ncbi:MAG: SurA N-terminal domain-containing protein [Deltaproteobacteria bacterium]|jgi:peptidyl-prolyl cis-trans isomerase D|nr:SurA N-terminal domain-containing protein [Deltaproteobacteria bacterium]